MRELEAKQLEQKKNELKANTQSVRDSELQKFHGKGQEITQEVLDAEAKKIFGEYKDKFYHKSPLVFNLAYQFTF